MTAIGVCSVFNAYKRPSRVVRASDRVTANALVATALGSVLAYSLTQWNLRGGRRSSVEKVH